MTGGLLSVGLIDRLLARRYLAAFLTVSTMTMLIVCVVELADGAANRSDTVSSAFTALLWSVALDMPLLYFLTAPLCSLLAAQWTIATSARRHELTAAYGAGISARRLLAPVIVTTMALTLAAVIVRDPLLQTIAAKRVQLDAKLGHSGMPRGLRDVWLRDRSGHAVHIERFHPPTATEPATIEGLDTDEFEGRRWIHTHAPHAVFQCGAWELTHGSRLERTVTNSSARDVVRLDGIEFTPDDVLLAYQGERSPLSLTSAEVATLRERNPFDTRWITLTEVHRGAPWSALVLVVLSMSFLVSTGPQRLASGLGKGLLAGLAYVCFDLLIRHLGLNGQVPPTWTGWLPVLAFGSVAVASYSTIDG